MGTCESCRFWELDFISDSKELKNQGECRKNAPQCQCFLFGTVFKIRRLISYTDYDYWCGEWERK